MNTEQPTQKWPKEFMTIIAAEIARQWFTCAQAAVYCGINPDTFSVMRAKGKGPKAVGPRNKATRFHRLALDRWMRTRT